MLIGFIGWFTIFYGEYFNYYIGMKPTLNWIEKLVTGSFLVFIGPFITGCIVTTIFFYFYSKHVAWRYLKPYIDQDKLLNRISQLECEISDSTRKKS